MIYYTKEILRGIKSALLALMLVKIKMRSNKLDGKFNEAFKCGQNL